MPVKPCLWPRCPNYELPGRSYCETHVHSRWQLGLTGSRGDSTRWQRLRRVVLKRSHGLCVCGALATDVHHIGSADDDRLENLVALCGPCHRRAHQRSRRLKSRRSRWPTSTRS